MNKEDSFVDLPDVRDKHDDTHKITLCFATLSLPPFVTAIGLISGALLFSIIAAFLAETSFKLVTEHSISWLLSTIELGFIAIMSYPVYMVSARPKKETTKVFPLSFVFLGLYYVAARLLTNYVADIADYVTQVIVKSAKVIPVMLIGMFAFKKRYSPLEFICGLAMFAGLVLFTSGNVSVAEETNRSSSQQIIAVIVGGISLICDALVSNTQEKLMEGGISESETTLKMASVAFVLCVIFGVLFGNLVEVTFALLSHPHGIYAFGIMAAAGLTAYVAVYFIVAILKRFGAVTAVMTTSCRKVITVLLSYIIYPKPINVRHLLGALLVFSALGIEIIIKYRRK